MEMQVESILEANSESSMEDIEDIQESIEESEDEETQNENQESSIEKQISTRGPHVPPKNILLKLLRPQHPNRLYSKIWNTKKIDNIVHHWLNEYRLDKEKAIRQLYQLYVDLSAYQHINVENFLETQGNDLNELVPRLEDARNNILSYTAKYFLFIRNKTNKVKQSKVEEFIEKFVAISAKEKLIYDFNLFLKLMNFFVNMSNSEKRSIRHTGVFIALKHQTGLVQIEQKITVKISSIQKALETEQNPELIEQMQTKIDKLKNYDVEVNKMISFLQLNIFCKNWNLYDPKLHYMRQECILELYKWIEKFPGRYLHTENLNFIMGAMIDSKKIVRYTALEVIVKIIENFEPQVHSKLCKIIIPVSKRITDTDYDVSVLAVDIITLIHRYIHIPSDIRQVICNHIYSINYPLAAACGRYVAEFIRERNKDNGDEGLLRIIMSFEKKAIKNEIVGMHPYFIEAVYDYFPVLQDIKLFMKILVENELNDELLTIWVNILTEAVHQTFNGKCSKTREKQKVRKVDPEKVQNMNKDLVRSLQILITHCSPLDKLTKLLLLIHENL